MIPVERKELLILAAILLGIYILLALEELIRVTRKGQVMIFEKVGNVIEGEFTERAEKRS